MKIDIPIAQQKKICSQEEEQEEEQRERELKKIEITKAFEIFLKEIDNFLKLIIEEEELEEEELEEEIVKKSFNFIFLSRMEKLTMTDPLLSFLAGYIRGKMEMNFILAPFLKDYSIFDKKYPWLVAIIDNHIDIFLIESDQRPS